MHFIVKKGKSAPQTIFTILLELVDMVIYDSWKYALDS